MRVRGNVKLTAHIRHCLAAFYRAVCLPVYQESKCTHIAYINLLLETLTSRRA